MLASTGSHFSPSELIVEVRNAGYTAQRVLVEAHGRFEIEESGAATLEFVGSEQALSLSSGECLESLSEHAGVDSVRVAGEFKPKADGTAGELSVAAWAPRVDSEVEQPWRCGSTIMGAPLANDH